METDERVIPVPELAKPLRVLHLTDTHLLLTDEGERAERNAYAASRHRYFDDPDGLTQSRRFLRLMELANGTDMLLMTGDILDFPSRSNLRFLRPALSRLTVPWLFVPGNHDYTYYDDHDGPEIHRVCREKLGEFCRGGVDFQSLQVGGLTFLGLSNGRERYAPGCVAALRSLPRTGGPVVIAQHIPFACDTLRRDTVAFWGKDICLGPGAAEGDGSAEEVLRLLEQSPRVAAVAAGHLHFSHLDRTGGGLLQAVTGMSCTGPAVLLTFSPGEISDQSPEKGTDMFWKG